MALRAHIHLEDWLCAAHRKRIATGARHRRLDVFGMDSGFHGFSWALVAPLFVAAIVWPRLGRALQRLPHIVSHRACLHKQPATALSWPRCKSWSATPGWWPRGC